MIRLGCDSGALGSLLHTEFVFPFADQLAEAHELQRQQDRFRGSTIVPIDRGLGDPLGLASIIDVERGARRPSDVPGWWDRQHDAGLNFLTVYASYDKMPAVEAAMAGRPFWHWFAYWDAGLFVPGHPDAMIQFASGPQLRAGVDLTLVHNDAWHPATKPLMPTVDLLTRAAAVRLAADDLADLVAGAAA